MGPAVHSVSANSGESVGVRRSTALLGRTQPERAFVSLGTVAHDPWDPILRRGGLRGARPARTRRSSGSKWSALPHSLSRTGSFHKEWKTRWDSRSCARLFIADRLTKPRTRLTSILKRSARSSVSNSTSLQGSSERQDILFGDWDNPSIPGAYKQKKGRPVKMLFSPPCG